MFDRNIWNHLSVLKKEKKHYGSFKNVKNKMFVNYVINIYV